MITPGIALVNGHFNVMHYDHLMLFKYASAFGKVIVGINDDAMNRIKYGADAIPAYKRGMVLAACSFVDSVVVFPEENATRLITELKPEYYVKGPDYLGKLIPEMDVCRHLGVKIIYRPGEVDYSSSRLRAAIH